MYPCNDVDGQVWAFVVLIVCTLCMIYSTIFLKVEMSWEPNGKQWLIYANEKQGVEVVVDLDLSETLFNILAKATFNFPIG
jgi:hypothetical protein